MTVCESYQKMIDVHFNVNLSKSMKVIEQRVFIEIPPESSTSTVI